MADKQKILIVDDDNNIAELISLYLVKECYDTLIVNDGESALDKIPEFKPDLMLLDIMLPGIDGYEVCRRVRTTSELPIIMLSAKGETFDKVLGLQLGADDYIEKPFDSKEMVARVKAVLRRSVNKTSEVKETLDSDIDVAGSLADYADAMLTDPRPDEDLSGNSTLRQLDIQARQLASSIKLQQYASLPSLALAFSYSLNAMTNDFKFSEYK